jgi:hypothetical protein
MVRARWHLSTPPDCSKPDGCRPCHVDDNGVTTPHQATCTMLFRLGPVVARLAVDVLQVEPVKL